MRSFHGLIRIDVPIIANVAGTMMEDYVETAKRIVQLQMCMLLN